MCHPEYPLFQGLLLLALYHLVSVPIPFIFKFKFKKKKMSISWGQKVQITPEYLNFDCRPITKWWYWEKVLTCEKRALLESSSSTFDK